MKVATSWSIRSSNEWTFLPVWFTRAVIYHLGVMNVKKFPKSCCHGLVSNCNEFNICMALKKSLRVSQPNGIAFSSRGQFISSFSWEVLFCLMKPETSRSPWTRHVNKVLLSAKERRYKATYEEDVFCSPFPKWTPQVKSHVNMTPFCFFLLLEGSLTQSGFV